VIADRITELWLLLKSLEIQEERIKRLEEKRLYPSILDHDKSMENNTVHYMTALKKLYADYDKLYQEIGYLDEVINTLPNQRQKETMRCRFICNLSVRQTADRLHFSERQVKRFTSQAFKKLHDRFD